MLLIQQSLLYNIFSYFIIYKYEKILLTHNKNTFPNLEKMNTEPFIINSKFLQEIDEFKNEIVSVEEVIIDPKPNVKDC